MNGDELEISASVTQLRSLSLNLTWKAHIHSLAKHAPQKLDFLARTIGFFSFSYLLTMYKSQFRPSLEFRKHQFQGVRMKLVLKSCCSIQPTWTILALLSCLTCREHGVRETTISAVVLK